MLEVSATMVANASGRSAFVRIRVTDPSTKQLPMLQELSVTG
jgi:hypothetical protein